MEVYYRSLEIYDRIVDVFSSDINSYKIACRRIETIYARASSSVCVYFSELLEKSVLNQFPDQFGNGRDTGVEFFAEVCETVVALVYA